MAKTALPFDIEKEAMLHARFWYKVDITGRGKCWPWTAALDPSGYGALKLEGSKRNAHVVAFLLCGGELGDGELVMHTCDNRACCNPAHLMAGTHKANYDDMVEKGRDSHLRGPRSDHGTYSRYNHWGCRCELCRRANADKVARHRASQKARGIKRKW